MTYTLDIKDEQGRYEITLPNLRALNSLYHKKYRVNTKKQKVINK